MSNSKEARALNRELREIHKDGLLEKIYERQETGLMGGIDDVKEEKKKSEKKQEKAGNLSESDSDSDQNNFKTCMQELIMPQSAKKLTDKEEITYSPVKS